ncbi:MAG: GHKL domain-containing protein, partial [Gammaproteobacteria bacterium]|nr:GHKL domain-containing protein [Gammaproteobacteria bacterium]
FTNLLENAIAYSDSPAKIEIVLSKSSQRVSIKIEDTPPGVDQNECDKLFDPLYRLDASRNSKGAGLGLSICRNIVIAHRGTISASPSKLGGLCIEINFPLLTEK